MQENPDIILGLEAQVPQFGLGRVVDVDRVDSDKTVGVRTYFDNKRRDYPVDHVLFARLPEFQD